MRVIIWCSRRLLLATQTARARSGPSGPKSFCFSVPLTNYISMIHSRGSHEKGGWGSSRWGGGHTFFVLISFGNFHRLGCQTFWIVLGLVFFCCHAPYEEAVKGCELLAAAITHISHFHISISTFPPASPMQFSRSCINYVYAPSAAIKMMRSPVSQSGSRRTKAKNFKKTEKSEKFKTSKIENTENRINPKIDDTIFGIWPRKKRLIAVEMRADWGEFIVSISSGSASALGALSTPSSPSKAPWLPPTPQIHIVSQLCEKQWQFLAFHWIVAKKKSNSEIDFIISLF